MDKKYIASIYKKFGMGTDAEVVNKLLQVAEKVFEQLELAQAKILVLTVFGISVSQESLNWLAGLAEDISPGLAADGADLDVRAVALTVLREALDEEIDIARKIGIAIEVAAFGGMRVCKEDPEFVGFAQDKLLHLQVTRDGIPELENLDESDLETRLEAIQEQVGSNNLSSAWPAIREAFEEIDSNRIEHSEYLYGKLRELTHATKAIEEQMQTQWFAIAKWSKTANKPFAKLPFVEAVTRAPYELAQLIKSDVGPVSAAALLQMALSDCIASAGDQKIAFEACCVGSPIVWRKAWVKPADSGDIAKMTPILAALSIATQSDDESDWSARFRREVGVDAKFEISPLEFALQLFHELILAKA